MNDEGIEWAIRELLKQRELAEAAYLLNRRTFLEFADRLDALAERVSALEAAKPKSLECRARVIPIIEGVCGYCSAHVPNSHTIDAVPSDAPLPTIEPERLPSAVAAERLGMEPFNYCERS